MNETRPRTPAAQVEVPDLPFFGERFAPVCKLAEGGMAEVFLAKDLAQSNRLIVLKRILPAYAKNPEFLAMFHDEARLALAMSHPNIVRVFEIGRAVSGPFMVMEYLAGQDLFEMVRRARRAGAFLPWQLIVAIGAQAADGVAHAHELTGPGGKLLNVIHRDLTPSNLFVTWDGKVKVLDFGIAHAERRLSKTQAGMLKGKAQYVAPEQVTMRQVDGRVDQFSLAAVLFELITGRVMFAAENELAAINAILEGIRPHIATFRPDVPGAIDEVIQRATLVEASQRYPDMRAFGDALRAALDGPVTREAIAQPLQHLFAVEFQSHAEFMARVSMRDSGRVLARVDLPHEPAAVTEPAHRPPRRSPAWTLAAAAAVGAGLGAWLIARSRQPAPVLRGSLVVRTDPPGARVVIDGQESSWTTPFSIDTLHIGRHRVEVTHPDRKPWSTDIDLTPSRHAATIDTALPRFTGGFVLVVDPPQAQVSIDGRPIEVRFGEANLADVTVGESHRLVIRAPGHMAVEQQVEARADEITRLRVALEPASTR